MFPAWLRDGRIAIVVATLSCMRAFAGGPAEDRLLRLVPSNAQIVAGIQDPHHGDESGRLLIVTHSDDADLRDWLALAEAVEDRQKVDKLIEAAASSPRGELSEHLLLVSGSFRGTAILHIAEAKGGVDDRYDGVQVVSLKPFQQELREMHDVRWLAIPDNNTIIFGSPAMVKVALGRYVSSAPADAMLMKRINDLKPDVNCWSILALPAQMMAAHMLPVVLNETSAALLRRTTSLSVSVHYGSKNRVDFIFGTKNPDSATTLATAISGQARLLSAADTPHARLERVSVLESEVRGSVRIAEKEFDSWAAAMYARISSTGTASGTEVAHAAVAY